MAQPLVSIIIPTFNRAHLIGETLDSVLAQTYTNWECIVVDDGSIDNTDEVLKNYCEKDARFKYVHRPNTHKPGGNGARNYGFELSKGDYIQWFDSDDLMLNLKVEIKLKEALKYQADIIIDKHSEVLQQLLIDDITVRFFESNTFYRDYGLGKWHLITDDVLVRRSIIGNLKFDERLHKAQEFDFFIRLFQQKLVYLFIDLPLTLYRLNEDSISKGNLVKTSKSLVYLCQKMMMMFEDDEDIIERFTRQGRKTYKNLAKNKNLRVIFENFGFFKKVHNKSTLMFFLWLLYNVITGRGFDEIKSKKI